MPRAAVIALPELKLCKNNSCSNVATGYTGYCYSCDSSRNLRNYSSSPTPRSNVKHPMGVEIECYNPESLRKVTHVAEYVCSDASLPDGGGEIKLCAPEDKLENIAADTVQRSSIVGNLVNKKCGLHVHMKLEALARWEYTSNMQTKRRIFEFAKAIEPYMFDISAKSRKENQYCRKLYDEYCLENHHSWITCSSRYPTIEVRIHGGTMNPWKVKGWLNAWKQIRPTLDKVALGKDDWQDSIQTVKAGDITDLLDANSIGYKYLKAREQANGKLENFGFSVDLTKKKTSNVNHSDDDYPEYDYMTFGRLRNNYLYKTDKIYYTNTRIDGRNVKLLLNYNQNVVGDFVIPDPVTQTPYRYELVFAGFGRWYVFSLVSRFRTVSNSLPMQLVPFV